MSQAIPFARGSVSMRPPVAIVGGGFGGLWAAKTLALGPVEVIVQPLLYQVATAGLSPADIAAPIRGIIGAYRNITVMLGQVCGIDVGRARS
jgi:NADH:ubiquinone reductase (H+-translocating)